MLTILAAFAQAESESGSVGAKVFVYQRKHEAGSPCSTLSGLSDLRKMSGESILQTKRKRYG